MDVTWANLPTPALIKIFRKMPVDSLISLVYTRDPGPNKHWLWVATSNEVWKDRYRGLFYQPEIRLLVEYWIHNKELAWNSRTSNMSLAALDELYAEMHGQPRLFTSNPAVEPYGFYFVHFMLVWYAVPHIWRNEKNEWIRVEFKVARNRSTYQMGEPGFYVNFLSAVHFEDRLIWIESNYPTEKPHIRHAPIPKESIALLSNADLRSNAVPESTRIKFTYQTFPNALDPQLWKVISGEILDPKIRRPMFVIFEDVQRTQDYITFLASGYDFLPAEKSWSMPWIHDIVKTNDLLQCSICANLAYMLCGSCQTTPYCSRECQLIDRTHGDHQNICQTAHKKE